MQRKKFKFIFFLILFSINCLSKAWGLGIDFIERISFNEDESGTFSIKVDLTKLRTPLTIIKLFKNYKERPQFICYSLLCNAQEQLKKNPHISEINVERDNKMLASTLKFRFKNIRGLNKAMEEINKGLDPPSITYFSLNEDIFVREDINGMAKELIFYQKNHKFLIKSLEAFTLFKETTYTTVYTFHKKIEDFSNPFSEVSKDRKTIRIIHHLFVPEETEESIKNRIHFEKNSA